MSDTVTIDKDSQLPVYSPVCTFCQHAHEGLLRTCRAFPNGIPEEIWTGKNPHVAPFPGDHGFRFLQIPGAPAPDV